MSAPIEKLTEDDLTSLYYFWQAKGDLERWCGWERAQPALARDYPEILKAWSDYKASIRILSAVLEKVANSG